MLLSKARFVTASRELGLTGTESTALWESANGELDKMIADKRGITLGCQQMRMYRAVHKLDALNRIHAVLLICSKIVEETP